MKDVSRSDIKNVFYLILVNPHWNIRYVRCTSIHSLLFFFFFIFFICFIFSFSPSSPSPSLLLLSRWMDRDNKTVSDWTHSPHPTDLLTAISPSLPLKCTLLLWLASAWKFIQWIVLGESHATFLLEEKGIICLFVLCVSLSHLFI